MIDIAVIGAGRIGRIHATNLHLHPGANLRCIVDVSKTAAAELAAHCDTQVGSLESVLGDATVQAVVIASSTNTHAELIEAAANAGKSIFCEKPLDLDVATAQKSLLVAEQRSVLLCVGFNRRHDPSFERVKKEIETGSVGDVEVVSITSRDPSPPSTDYIARSGGLYKDMMIHDFDMGRWLLGEEPIEVFAFGSVLVDEKIRTAGDIDTAVATLRTESGRLCQITNSRRCSYGYDQRIEVFGSSGMARAGNQRETLVETASAAGYARDRALPFFLERYADAYRIQLDRFLRVVDGEELELPSGTDGLRALQIADAAQRSSDSGLPVSL
ncbi:MAG: inositol 2-dehydrogenase [Proteobacteria bacterium]|nr:inositol 2-dehydrogenase [Pseudomonadota bacterium]